MPKDKKIIEKIIKSYKIFKINNYLKNAEDFILTGHEVHEFLKLKQEDIIRYALYRYKYNIYPKLGILEDYPPNIQIEPTSICNLRCVMCYQKDKSFSQSQKDLWAI